MYKVLFCSVLFLTLGQSVFAQFGSEALRFQNKLSSIGEARQLKVDAATYFYTNKNKKLACLTIQQAYEVELQSGYSEPSTRDSIRKYCS